jgi:hypothetical protein
MPIDINFLRDPSRGGEPDRWREMTRKRNKPVELVDRVIDLDEVRACREAPRAVARVGRLEQRSATAQRARLRSSFTCPPPPVRRPAPLPACAAMAQGSV